MRELWNAEDHPNEVLGVRRFTDRCFHEAEEEVEEGFIVQGVLIRHEEIAEVRRAHKGGPGEQTFACGK